jgi:hypothetical protein
MKQYKINSIKGINFPQVIIVDVLLIGVAIAMLVLRLVKTELFLFISCIVLLVSVNLILTLGHKKLFSYIIFTEEGIKHAYRQTTYKNITWKNLDSIRVMGNSMLLFKSKDSAKDIMLDEDICVPLGRKALGAICEYAQLIPVKIQTNQFCPQKYQNIFELVNQGK